MIARRVVEDLAQGPLALTLLDDQHGRAAGVRAGADLVMLLEVRVEGFFPGPRVPAVRRVECAQFVVLLECRECDSPEHGIADKYPERPLVARDPRRLRLRC